MINWYIKNYKYRIGPIAIYLLALISILVASTTLLSRNLIKSSMVESSYSSVKYNYGYELNYSCESALELIYPDTDIVFYTSSNKSTRIVSTSVMENRDGIQESMMQFDFSKIKASNEVIIPINISQKYSLKVGDTIFCEYPFSTSLFELKIVDISPVAYDFASNSIDNEVGIMGIGYCSEYTSNSNCKYILLSEASQTDLIGNYPQILKRTFNADQFKKSGEKLLLAPIGIYAISFATLLFLYFVFVGKNTLLGLVILRKRGLTFFKIRLFSIAEWGFLFLVPIIIFWICIRMIIGGLSAIFNYSLFALVFISSLIDMLLILIFTKGGRIYDSSRSKRFKY